MFISKRRNEMAKYDWGTFGFHIPEIMLPKEGTDYSKWAVVACDQYTSEPEYWDEVEKIVGDAPSALRLMLPEIYLEKEGEAEKIQAIRKAMDEYLSNGVLRTLPKGCMLIKRTAEGRSRIGLVIATDLEAYDFNKGSKSLTRATEGTVIERIPPRLRIREGAPIEMPHILILIDDPEKSVIEPLVNAPQEQIYDTDLMMEGGHITGSFMPWETATTHWLPPRPTGKTLRRPLLPKKLRIILQDMPFARSKTFTMKESYSNPSTESSLQRKASPEWIS